jgi:hypothetical protein
MRKYGKKLTHSCLRWVLRRDQEGFLPFIQAVDQELIEDLSDIMLEGV